MHATWRATFAAGVLALGGVLGMGASPARAQAVGPARPAAYPGYYYSPGGYSGGYYFSPGYYPRTAGTAAAPGGAYYGSSAVVRLRRPAVNYHDWTTGRDNLPIPLAKPWLRPLR
jgi:hypothetical protein